MDGQDAAAASPVRLLLVEDDASVAKLVQNYFKTQRYTLQHVPSVAAAIDALKGPLPDLVLLDLGLPDRPGQDLLQLLHEEHPGIPVVVATGLLEAEAAMACLRAGACDFLNKPFNLAELHSVVQRELLRSRLQLQARSLSKFSQRRGFDRLSGGSPAILAALQALTKAAPLDINLLLTGETGTGKDLAALAVHEASPRSERPFIALDCGALPDRLVESELFGYERGAFTGADARKRGRLELADGGTLFLDEIGNLTLGLQAKLLRVLQERRFRRLGGSEEVKVDVRVIAATNVDLAAARADGTFRDDLYFRLGEFHVELPPLRERGGDVLALAALLLEVDAVSFDRSVPALAADAAEALRRHAWPGNVRELRHVLRRGLLACGRVLELKDLPPELGGSNAPPKDAVKAGTLEQQLHLALEAMEPALIRRALDAAKGGRQEAADALGVDVKTLYNKMKRHGIG